MIEGVVLSCVGGRYRVWFHGQRVEAVLPGRAKHRLPSRVLVGDHVTLAPHHDAPATIERVLPRHTLLQRRRPGRGHGARPVAANVDRVMVVGATRHPDWDPYLIDRFVAVAEANRLPASIVVNKVDLDPETDGLAAPYIDAGYAVLVTSVPARQGLDDLRAMLAGHVTLFTGPTGVGKSSLLNVILPGLRLRTADVSPRSQTGRHTTVAADMHAVDDQTFVVDTPGLRDVGLWGLSPHEVGAAFPELARLRSGCRFNDCRHGDEPGCAVRGAVDAGTLHGSRYESYRRMLQEAERAARPWL